MELPFQGKGELMIMEPVQVQHGNWARLELSECVTDEFIFITNPANMSQKRANI
jgi:hypothetical protein